MKRSLVILNFTHSYETQPFLRQYPASWIDCTRLQGTDCYCSPESYRQLQEMLAPFPPEGLHLIDSGDYHYVTKLWTDKIDRPFSLVLFDHHPDMQPTLFDELLSCGCWVRTMLDTNPFLQKVCLVGANEALKSEMEGYDSRLIFFSEQSLASKKAWQFFSERHIHEPLYLSVDKDVLSPRFATTNWDQGSMTLPQLESLLHIIMAHDDVVGIDVCGELPPYLSQAGDDTAINEASNRSLIEFIGKYAVQDAPA